jgi:hypothetical protein
MKVGMDESKKQQSERSNCESQKADRIQYRPGFRSLMGDESYDKTAQHGF